MTLTCRDVLALQANYLDGELPEEAADRVRRHLLRCASCRDEYETTRMAVEVLRTVHPPVTLSESATRALLAHLTGELDIATNLPDPPGQLVLGIGAGLSPRL